MPSLLGADQAHRDLLPRVRPSVVDTESGLSVAEAVPASIGRPLLGLVVALGCLALIGGAAYGDVRIYRHVNATAAAQASSDVRRGVGLLVSAESGQAAACHQLGPVVAQPAATTLTDCRAVVGDDKDAHLDEVSVGSLDLGKGTGSVQVRATVTDASGTRMVERTVALTDVRRQWRMAWDGAPLAANRP